MSSRSEDILRALIDDEEYQKEPMSRIEKILISIINDEEYTEEPQSRIEALLLELKNKISLGDSLVNTSGFDLSTIRVGDTITIVGSATGGTAPYTYDFYIKRGTAANWSSREPDQGDNVINLRPTSATSYQVKIDVTDSEGTTASKILSFSSVADDSVPKSTAVNFNVQGE